MDLNEHEQNKLDRESARLRRDILAAADFKAVADLPEGRRFLRRVLAECGVHHSSMVFPADAMAMSYREGRRSVGLWLQSLFSEIPDHYIRLLMEEAADSDS